LDFRSNTTVEDDDDYAAASEPASDSVVRLDVPQVKEVTTDDKDLRIESSLRQFDFIIM